MRIIFDLKIPKPVFGNSLLCACPLSLYILKWLFQNCKNIFFVNIFQPAINVTVDKSNIFPSPSLLTLLSLSLLFPPLQTKLSLQLYYRPTNHFHQTSFLHHYVFSIYTSLRYSVFFSFGFCSVYFPFSLFCFKKGNKNGAFLLLLPLFNSKEKPHILR